MKVIVQLVFGEYKAKREELVATCQIDIELYFKSRMSPIAILGEGTTALVVAVYYGTKDSDSFDRWAFKIYKYGSFDFGDKRLKQLADNEVYMYRALHRIQDRRKVEAQQKKQTFCINTFMSIITAMLIKQYLQR